MSHPCPRRLFPLPAILLAALLSIPPLFAETAHWPQWRGPAKDGISSATGIPSEWSRTKNVRWRLPLPGPAASTPVVWGERLYLTSAVGEDDLALLAVSKAGEIVWQKKIDSGNYDARSGESNAASPSPVTDGEHLWITLGTGTLAAFDLDGNEKWRVDLEERYKDFNYYFGMSSTPLLDGDSLYLLLMHTDQQMVIALDKATGEERWTHERATDAEQESRHSYASPVLYDHGGKRFLVIHGADYVTAHDLASGAEIWRRGGLNPKDNYNSFFRFVASPAVAPGLIVVPSAKNGPVLGLAPDGQVRWRLDRGTPDVPTPLIHDGLVYLSRENGMLTVVDAETGETAYSERVQQGPHRGSPLLVDGKLLLVAMDGTVSVIQPGREFVVLAKNDLEEHLAASPVAVGDTLYLRSHAALYAIGEPKATPAPPQG